MRIHLAEMHCVITGGAGLIGSYLVDHLLTRGARVTVVDDLSKGRLDNLAQSSGRYSLRKGDLEDRKFAVTAFADADVVFHLASRAFGVAYSERRHLEILEHNERITTNLFEALRRKPPRALLVTSSSCVYPDDGPNCVSELPVFTGDPEIVNRGYGWAKRFLEAKTELFRQETQVATTIVRPFNIYGERYVWQGQFSQAIPMLVKRVLDGDNPLVVWGSGQQRRNYIHADDCAWMMMRLIEEGHLGPVNIGTEETITMEDLVRLICEVAGRSPEIHTDASKPEGRFVKSASSQALRNAIPDFRLTIDLESGIRRMLPWYMASFGKTV